MACFIYGRIRPELTGRESFDRSSIPANERQADFARTRCVAGLQLLIKLYCLLVARQGLAAEESAASRAFSFAFATGSILSVTQMAWSVILVTAR